MLSAVANHGLISYSIHYGACVLYTCTLIGFKYPLWSFIMQNRTNLMNHSPSYQMVCICMINGNLLS
jgi:hypothetical protein